MCRIAVSRRTPLAAAWPRILLLSAALARPAAAAPTILDFEDIPAPAKITTQYSARGVLFGGAFLSKAPLFSFDAVARSGTQVLRVSNPSEFEFSPEPLVITFTSPQSRVRMFAGSEVVAISGTLRAFDAANNVVGTDGPKTTTPNQFTTLFEVALTSKVITRVELAYDNSAHEAIDDLEFEGDPPAPPPPQAPVVQITSPVNGADLDVTQIDIKGTVTGEGLLPPAIVTIDWQDPPGSTAPTFQSALDLTGTGTTREFALLGFGVLPLGPITITVEAENFGGMKGSAAVAIHNLPAAIRQRFTAEGGAATFGAFQFGTTAGGCRIAVYERGAISVNDAGVTRLILGEILTKWLSRTGVGCPREEERDSLAGGGSRVQEFDTGRIYTTPNIGTFFVPAVFVDAIEKRGGEPATGVPINDPTDSVGPMQTWLFQRFVRPERLDLLPSTLEIRGTPPRLWMERQSGDLSVNTSGTIWEHFPCDGTGGPCAVDPTLPPPEPIPDPGDKFCEGTTFKPVLRGPREWEPVRDRSVGDPYRGDYRTTPLFGVVISSKMADYDLWLTHEWSYNCPGETVRPDCPSDWLVFVRPYGPHLGIEQFPHKGADGRPSLFFGKHKDRVKLEYERFYGEFVVWMGFPRVGDLIFTAGRWICDCGHDSYKSELHPISMYCKMKTVTSITDPFTKLVDDTVFGGQPATQADLWVNGWYPGFDPGTTGPRGDPIEFDIFPPPRPTPDATLVINKPVDEDAVRGLDFQWSSEPPGAASHVHIRITAPYRENHVTDYGEMIYETNRSYEGQWYLYWATP